MNEQVYLNLLNKILTEGKTRTDRTGVGTISLFGEQVRYDLREGFPLLTTKKVHFKSVKGELLWMLSGSTSAKELRDKYGVTIWDEWEDETGDLGPIYGKQWRNWEFREGITIDQISQLILSILYAPESRRHIVSCWNVSDINDMALAPCHTLFQVYVDGDELDLQLYQRSADMFLGVPFNIASYSLLLSMIAQVTDKKPRYFIHTLGDAHIYTNHIDQVKLQLSREPRQPPKLSLNPNVKDIDFFTMDDIKVEEYNPHPTIKAEVAV